MAVLASDTFDSLGAAVALSGRTLDNGLGGSGSRSWIVPTGGTGLRGNGSGAIEGTNSSNVNIVSVTGAFKARVRVNPNGATNNLALWARRDSDSSTDGLLLLYVSQTSLRVASVAAGTRTDHATVATTAPGTTFWMELEISGLVVTCRILNNDLSVRNTASHTFSGSLPAGGDFWGFGFFQAGQAALFDDFIVDDGAAGDVTAPTLTSPTGTATGSTTATGTVTTDEGNGTLYRLASTNATETAPTVVAAALSQTVTTTGGQNVSFTGLSPSTVYYAHYVQDDAALNRSARVSSASFTTDSVDVTAPTLTAATAVSISNAAMTGTVTTDEANGTQYMVATTSATPPSAAQIRAGQNNTGAAAVFAANQAISSTGVKTFNVTGLAELTTYYLYYHHRDSSNNDSSVVSANATTFRDGATGQTVVDTTGPVGDNPEGIMYNDVVLPGDANKWFSYRIVSGPTTPADFTFYADGSFVYTGTTGDTFDYQLEVDGVDTGSPQTVTVSEGGTVEPDTGITSYVPFPLKAGKVQITTAAVESTDVYLAGLRYTNTGSAIRGVATSGVVYSNGKPLSATGQLCYVDATASLPAGTQWSGGLPYSNGALCVSTGAVAYTQNGVAFAANGAVAVEIVV